MTNIPTFLTHYCLADRQPFLTLSDLEAGMEDTAFKELQNRHKHSSDYQRRYGSNYLETRRKVERKLRRLFLARGGVPIRQYPFYFVLGESNWFRGLVKEHREIKIDISTLDFRTTSFTFPDSYIALSRDDKPYHGQVFLLHELEIVVARYGLPSDNMPDSYRHYWKGDFEKYIEFQIWDDKVVQPFIDEYWLRWRRND